MQYLCVPIIQLKRLPRPPAKGSPSSPRHRPGGGLIRHSRRTHPRRTHPPHTDPMSVPSPHEECLHPRFDGRVRSAVWEGVRAARSTSGLVPSSTSIFGPARFSASPRCNITLPPWLELLLVSTGLLVWKPSPSRIALIIEDRQQREQ